MITYSRRYCKHVPGENSAGAWTREKRSVENRHICARLAHRVSPGSARKGVTGLHESWHFSKRLTDRYEPLRTVRSLLVSGPSRNRSLSTAIYSQQDGNNVVSPTAAKVIPKSPYLYFDIFRHRNGISSLFYANIVSNK